MFQSSAPLQGILYIQIDYKTTLGVYRKNNYYEANIESSGINDNIEPLVFALLCCVLDLIYQDNLVHGPSAT